MKFLILLPALFAAAIHASINLNWSPDSEANLNYDIDQEWINFKETYGRTYESSDEEEERFAIFKENLESIRNHNRHYSNGLATYKQGVNKFSDMTFEEFSKSMSTKLIRGNRKTGSTFLRTLNSGELPKEVDWRKAGYVTPVKNQKHCGSCYAFSAVGAIEGQHFRKTGKLVSLSEQNIIDCSVPFGNTGCGGGGVDRAFEYVEYVHGIQTEEDYPYVDKKHFRCRFNKNKIAANITGHVKVQNMTDLVHALATVGPISVSINLTPGFRDYKGGVLNDTAHWRKYLINHAILAVGYGTEHGDDYILVKNSWGADFGDHGYIKIAQNEQSGLIEEAYYPLV